MMRHFEEIGYHRIASASLFRFSPFAKGERIEVRGFCRAGRITKQNPHRSLSLAKGEANSKRQSGCEIV